MRIYRVRRTRSFIQENYGKTDPQTGRRYLSFENGQRFYLPTRRPRTIKFTIDDADAQDPYAKLQSTAVVTAINGLTLPRYGMGNYEATTPHEPPTAAEAKVLAGSFSRWEASHGLLPH